MDAAVEFLFSPVDSLIGDRRAFTYLLVENRSTAALSPYIVSTAMPGSARLSVAVP